MKCLAVIIFFVCTLHALADDNRWKIFHAGSSGLAGDVVTALACDSLGNIWIGTDEHGTGMYNGIGWEVYRGSALQTECIVSSITVTPRFDVYIGYNGAGIGAFEKKHFVRYTKDSVALPSDNVQDVVADYSGAIWIGTTHGIAKRSRDGEWRNENEIDLPSKKISAIAVDRAKAVWLGFVDIPGLAMYDGKSVQLLDHDHSNFPDTKVIDIAIDNSGAVWAATEKSGVVKYDKGVVTIYSTANSGIVNDKVYALSIDTQNHIWVATAGGGGMYDGDHWVSFTMENSPLPSNHVYAVTVDRKGRGWFGTDDGLAVVTLVAE